MATKRGALVLAGCGLMDGAEIVLNEANRVVSTPAYMRAQPIDEVWDGVSKLVKKVLAMA